MIKEKYRQLLKKELTKLSYDTIVVNTDGSYQVFGKYRIKSKNAGYLVSKFGVDIGWFRKTNSALSWCIADNINRHQIAIDIKYLDQKLSFLTDDINLRMGIANSGVNSDTTANIHAKLESKLRTKNELETRLQHYITQAKYWQSRGITNEIKRNR